MPLPSVGDSVVDDSIPPLEEDDANAISMFQNTRKCFLSFSSTRTRSPLPVVNPHSSSSLSELSDPYAFDIPTIPQELPSVPALSNYLDEPLNPEFHLLTNFYSEPVVSDTEEVSNRSSFTIMIHTAETYKEPATCKQANMSWQTA